MGLIDRTLAAFGYVKANEAQTVMGGEIPFGFLGDYNWRGDGTSVWTEERLKRYAQQSSWVFSDVDLIANSFSVAELQVFRKKGEELKAVYDHDFEKIVEMPSTIEFIDASFLWKFSLTWGLLHGEFYWLLNTDRTGVLRELIPIPSDRIWPVPDPKEYISHFMYQPSTGQPVPLPRDKIFFWRRPGRSFHRGQSLFEPLNRPLETDVAASQWNVDSFKKGLSLQTVLGLPDTLSNALFEQAKADIERAMTEEQRRFLITRSGQVSAQTVGVTHKDAEFLSMRDLTRREIDRIFGIPEGYWSEKATRANAEAAHIGLYRHAIMPLRVSVQRAITAQIMRRFYGDDLRAKFKDDIPPDQSTWEAKTLDEVRADIGLPPWHDKDQGKTLFPLAKTGKWEGGEEQQPPPGAPQQPPPGAGPDGSATPPRPGKDGAGDDQTPPEGKQPQGAEGKQPAPKDQPTAAPAAIEKPEAKGYTSLDLTDTPLTIPNPVEADTELRADLRRWRSIARREVKAGNAPASRHFHSHHIPEWMQVDILVGLAEARDEPAVKAVFDNVLEAKAVTFIPRGAADPLPALGTGLPLGEPGRETEDEAAMAAAAAAWDRTMPEYAGLLDARPVGALVGLPAMGMAEFAKAYTLVDEELKGGKGSGNWGHAGGRGGKGKPGGSRPRSEAMSRTSGRDWQKRQAAAKGGKGGGGEGKKPQSYLKPFDRDALDEKLKSAKLPASSRKETLKSLAKAPDNVKNFVQGLAEYEDEESGLRIGVVFHSAPFGSNVVVADIIDKDGKKVGKISRRFDSAEKVTHSEFQLDEEYQNTGFGTRFYMNSEQSYKEMGVKEIALTANLDVGGYAWARMGFSPPPQDFDVLNDMFAKEYKKRFKEPPPAKPANIQELAAYKGPNGERVGKDVLMGTWWSATKSLDEADPGYQAGQEYYRQKGLID